MCISNRRLSRAQSSNANLANIGSESPSTSRISSMPKTSNFSRFSSSSSRTFIGGFSSAAPSFALPSPAGLFSASSFTSFFSFEGGGAFGKAAVSSHSANLSGAFPSPFNLAFLCLSSSFRWARLTGSLYSMCLICQFCKSFCQLFHFSLNHSEGPMCSTRVVTLRWNFHFIRRSSHLCLSCHMNLISSNPSSSVGKPNPEKAVLTMKSDKSDISPSRFRKSSARSAAVSSTLGGCSSSTGASSSVAAASTSASTSLASAGSSLASSPSAASASRFCRNSSIFFLILSARFRAFSTAFWRSSQRRFRTRSAFLLLNSAKALSCFSFRSCACTAVL
mmetsp:Transcript_2977/g.8981  ORF Transcript_2977/g.8981 Transcript_2977/m.8981 type:complete len:335 (-) Transcript_2977:1332-2336(-)